MLNSTDHHRDYESDTNGSVLSAEVSLCVDADKIVKGHRHIYSSASLLARGKAMRRRLFIRGAPEPNPPDLVKNINRRSALFQVLNSHDFNKKHKHVSMKPISLMCLLRASKSQMQENGYNDVVIETVYELILENAAKDSESIAFPDIYVPCVVQVKIIPQASHHPGF